MNRPPSPLSRVRAWSAIVALATLSLVLPTAARAQTAPGAPGDNAIWTPADKDGYGTSTTRSSKVWHTLDDGRLTEVYYPDLGTPSVRTLDFVVSDGETFAERDSDAAIRAVDLADSRSLTYRQVNEEPGRFRITKTYVTDPGRNVLLVDVRLESLTGKALDAYAVYDPGLGNDGMDDSGTSAGDALLASDAGSPVSSALVASPGFTKTSNGYLGTSDGWKDLADFRMDWTYDSAPSGNVVQTGKTPLTGLGDARDLTLAVGFGPRTQPALGAAKASLAAGFTSVRAAYESGWHNYLGKLKGVPPSASGHATTYNVSVMTLAAHEDKTHRGGYIASPTMPWVWGTGLENPSGAYHLVWARDLYQIATALIAAGDSAGANRAVDYLFFTQQKAEARSRRTPQSTERRIGETCNSTRSRSRSCSRGSSGAPTRTSTRTTSRRRPISSSTSPARRSPLKSAGRTRAAIRRGRSRPRSPA